MTAPNPLYQEGYSMTDKTDQQAVTVAQEDREAAAALVEWHTKVAREWETVNGGTMQFFTNDMPRATRTGTWDEHSMVQAFARHRLASVSSASAEGDLHDVITHRSAWRNCIEMMLSETDDDNGTGYYTHELKAFDRTFDRLAMLAASPEPVPATNQAGEVGVREVMARRILAAEITNEDAASKLLKGIDRLISTKAAIRAMFAFAALPVDASLQSINAEHLARRFHEAYERLAPSFGYETRPETREFDPTSANGKLMIAVCSALATQPATSQEEEAVAWCNAGQLAYLMETDSDGGTYLPVRKTKRGNFIMPLFAATPTPPTLSEDLRDDEGPIADAARRIASWSGNKVGVYQAAKRELAALAQGKAS